MSHTLLSEAARNALVNTERRQGARVAAASPVLIELSAAGLIGDGTGLTRKGLAVRNREYERRLDAAF